MATPLKRERQKRNMTTEELAVAVGVRQPTINRIENARKKASPALAHKLAKFFNGAVTRDEILFPEEYVDVKARKPVRSHQLQEVG
jgi:DNA-binding XRE family transcriptional regulator